MRLCELKLLYRDGRLVKFYLRLEKDKTNDTNYRTTGK